MSGFALSKLDIGLDQQVSLIKDSMTYRVYIHNLYIIIKQIEFKFSTLMI